MKKRTKTKKHGLAAVITLAALAIIGTFVALAAREIVFEKEQTRQSLRRIQTQTLTDDLSAIAKKIGSDINVTIPKELLSWPSDMKFNTHEFNTHEPGTVSPDPAREEKKNP